MAARARTASGRLEARSHRHYVCDTSGPPLRGATFHATFKVSTVCINLLRNPANQEVLLLLISRCIVCFVGAKADPYPARRSQEPGILVKFLTKFLRCCFVSPHVFLKKT